MHILTRDEAIDIIDNHIYEAYCIHGDDILLVAQKIVFLADVSCLINKAMIAKLICDAGGCRVILDNIMFS